MKALISAFCVISIALVFSTSCYAQVETRQVPTPEGTFWRINNAEIVSFLGGVDHIAFTVDYILLCDNGCLISDTADYKKRLISRFAGSWNTYVGEITVKGYLITFLKFGKMTLCFSALGQCYTSTLSRDYDYLACSPCRFP